MDQDRRDAAAWAREWQIKQKNRRLLMVLGGIVLVAVAAFLIKAAIVLLERTTFGSEEEMRAALEAACAWEFVSEMPGGLYSDIYEGGKGLSEGQAQRVSIARAVLRGAPVLLMDEATSALDVEMERRLLRSILKKSDKQTIIITTHRPTVLSMCDRVYRVVDGKIVRLGEEEIETIATAVRNHSSKSEIGSPIEEIVKDADVLDFHQCGYEMPRKEQKDRLDAMLAAGWDGSERK